MFQNKYYQDLSVIEVNTAPLRNYYVPFSTKKAAILSENRQESDRFMLLDGQWDFDFYSSIHEIPVDFMQIPLLDLHKKISVPSCIQNQGYDAHQYVNVSFPIPYDPPYTPFNNPCGIYRRTFEPSLLEDQAYYLNFEGVDSNMYVWVNEHFVGYDQVTHSNSEFDISSYLRDGENQITVLVMKWCVGTYFEDQDKFRTTGIIRSVYIIQREIEGLWDYKIETPIDISKKSGVLKFKTDYQGEMSYTLLSPNGEVLKEGATVGSFELEIRNCHYWTAETPSLYSLIIEAKGEFIREKVGFRAFTIANRVLYLNGQPIKIYGVNHHDSHPDVGPSMLKEDYRVEMDKMKALNMNAIRTAHYPKSPEFYELADEMGFYVLSEADIESHGVVNLFGESADYNLMARDEMFGKIIEDRVLRSIIPFQNRPSIFMWSMQNESGYGINYEKAQARVRELDDTRLIHNERAAEPDISRKNDFSCLDVVSRMYSPLRDIIRYCEGNTINKPFLQCEYAHAMGNGPGDLADYFDLMEKYPSFIGGFVWEWADHAMYYDNDKGERVLGYGGDFGESLHDSNFCVDGLLFPDRRLTSSAIEYRNIHSPIQLKIDEENRIVLRNIQSFLTGSEFNATLSVSINGEKSQELFLDLSELGPLSKMIVPCVLPQTTEMDYVTVDFVLLNQSGDEIAHQQKMIQEGKKVSGQLYSPSIGMPILLEQKKDLYVLSNPHFTYFFDSRTGTFEQMIVEGEVLLVEPSKLSIWRAPTDNDRNIANEWREAGYESAVWNLLEFSFEQNENGVTFHGHYHLGQPKTQNILTLDLTVSVHNAGEIVYEFKVIKGMNLPDFPRFGIVFPLNKQFNQVDYLGYGPYDSYVDKHHASYFGKHNQEISELFENYLKPQENGNHWKTIEVKVKGNQTCEITSQETFNFSFIPYSSEELSIARHSYDLPEVIGHYLTIDYKQNGIGSNSCGPYLLEKYRFSDQIFDWNFKLSFK
ncbi:glycoside hydrolase family 2 TIM barrel-domain containing protein [Enterococcus sp. LJL98]